MLAQAPVNMLEPPPGLMMSTFIILVTVVVIAGGALYFLVRWIRPNQHSERELAGENLTAARFAVIEDRFQRLTEQVEQLKESQEFTTQLLQRRGRTAQQQIDNGSASTNRSRSDALD